MEEEVVEFAVSPLWSNGGNRWRGKDERDAGLPRRYATPLRSKSWTWMIPAGLPSSTTKSAVISD